MKLGLQICLILTSLEFLGTLLWSFNFLPQEIGVLSCNALRSFKQIMVKYVSNVHLMKSPKLSGGN